jgi:hypothetical protein
VKSHTLSLQTHMTKYPAFIFAPYPSLSYLIYVHLNYFHTWHMVAILFMFTIIFFTVLFSPKTRHMTVSIYFYCTWFTYILPCCTYYNIHVQALFCPTFQDQTFTLAILLICGNYLCSAPLYPFSWTSLTHSIFLVISRAPVSRCLCCDTKKLRNTLFICVFQRIP